MFPLFLTAPNRDYKLESLVRTVSIRGDIPRFTAPSTRTNSNPEDFRPQTLKLPRNLS